MELIRIMHLGYAMVIAAMVLIIWISLSGANTEIEHLKHPPCLFNPLCSCSKNFQDLGIVQCRDIELPRIPETINQSKVFMLHLENNGLRTIDSYFLQSTGLFEIIIKENPLYIIPDEAFLGLERSLWQLELSYDQLSVVPNHALRYLQRLRLLNLRGNSIIKISPDNWRGLESSLTTLVLSDNSIYTLPMDSFSNLPKLETLDLSGNNLRDIDPSVFRDGMGKLSHLILSDNYLMAIPYQALMPLKHLKHLDLGYNLINSMNASDNKGIVLNYKFNLDIFDLEYNEISILEPFSFQYFGVLNRTYLDGNQLNELQENAFRSSSIRELYLRYCGLKHILPDAFEGLENSLEILDLSGNEISDIPDDLFNNFQSLKSFSLQDNAISNLNTVNLFSTIQYTLYELDLSGSNMKAISIQDLRRLRSLRTLSISKLSQQSLAPEDFLEFGMDLEDIEIVSASLTTIKNNAFKYVHGLRRLKLSENNIGTLESNAFNDVGHSLKILIMSHAFSSSLQNVPADAMKPLTDLEELDFSNNKIRTIPETAFHFMKHLRILNMQDNAVEVLQKGTFQGDIHDNLEEIYLSFNSLKSIQQHTFVDLRKLEEIHLDDNQIVSLERRSFMNLENTRTINLKGNKIQSIPYEAFQNLPKLDDLDIAFNKLVALDFTMFDQVGTLSNLQVNMSYNSIMNLQNPSALTYQPDLGPGSLHSNIKILDLSHNNISYIAKQFFKPVQISLTELHLQHNKLLNATKDIFGNMPHLQVLDISYNGMYDMDFDTFRNTKRLQIFDASHNRLAEIPNDIFKFLSYLRIVDFSYNRLRSLPDNLFRDESIEKLDISHNMLSKIPLTSFSIAAASTISELDVSWNGIASLFHGEILSRFKRLSYINLSYNRLAQIDAGTFKGIPRLVDLDLGHNNQLTLEANGLSFQGLENTLLHLNLDNISMVHVPILPTSNLLTLGLAHNSLPTIPSELTSNLTYLRELDLSHNDLKIIPILMYLLPELRYLKMAANPISLITNTSLFSLADRLIEFDLRNVDLKDFETGALCKMNVLRVLRITLYRNLSNILGSTGIRTLELAVIKDTEGLDNIMSGEFSVKLNRLIFSGRGLKKLGNSIFQGIRSPHLYVQIYNTSLMTIPSNVFQNLEYVKNISLDVKENYQLKTLHNPSTGSRPNLPRKTFLIDLSLSSSKWSCDCDLGWVEFWQRKKRQYLCQSLDIPSYRREERCRHTDDDLRTTLCDNKQNKSLIEVLKTDIECGWSSTERKNTNQFILILMFISVLFLMF